MMKKKLLGFAVTGCMVAMGIARTSTAGVTVPTKLPLLVSVGCVGSGASDTAGRKHVIVNTTPYPIPAGTLVLWKTSDGGAGSLKLTADLAPKAYVDVVEGGATKGYTCTASFSPPPADFAVKSVSHDATKATVVIQNLNPWTVAQASIVRVSTMKCVDVPSKSVDANVPTIPALGEVTVTVPISFDAASEAYVQAVANATASVSESVKGNNIGKSAEAQLCNPK